MSADVEPCRRDMRSLSRAPRWSFSNFARCMLSYATSSGDGGDELAADSVCACCGCRRSVAAPRAALAADDAENHDGDPDDRDDGE